MERDSDVLLHIYHMQKLLARGKLQVELVDMTEDLGPLFFLCGLVYTRA